MGSWGYHFVILPLLQYLCRGGDVGKLAVQTGDGRVVYQLGTKELSVFPLLAKSGCGIVYQCGVKPQVSGHSGGGGHTVVCGESRNDQFRDVGTFQSLLEVGANEGTVDILFDHRLSLQRGHQGMDGIARMRRM